MALRRTAVPSTVLAVLTTLAVLLGVGGTAAPAAGRAATGRTLTAVASSVPTTGFKFVDITARDGVVLKANVISPTTQGLHPAIVFVNSWGLNDAEYLAQATAFAKHGYVVLSYTTRGFWGSGGEIDTAGPKDMADMSSAIDWLLANTSADPAHIGAAGCSYGAGISLLASAFEPRIRAVVAMSGWTDLVRSLYGNDTRRPQAVWLLKAAAQLFGRPSPELTNMINAYFANQDLDPITQWGRVRSAINYIGQLNRNHPAIMMANSYGDSLFAPNQLVDFFNQYTGPKRLEFAPGDHVVVEATGLVGLPNHVWDSTTRWFDQYLAGVRTGIDTEPPVVLRRLDSPAVESYDDWAHVTTSTERFNMGAVRVWDGTGPLSAASVSSGWSRSMWTGTDTTADAGVALLTNGLAALTGIPPTIWLPTVNRLNAGVWVSDPIGGGLAIRGMPKLHMSIDTSAPKGTLIAYLYDTDAVGTGRLISHAPISWLTPTHTLDLKFECTAYDVPAGHRLALVLDSVDPLYLGANQNGTRIDFTGASWFDAPVR